MKAKLIGALNGVLGDYLHDTGNPLAIPLELTYMDKPLEFGLPETSFTHKGDVCIFLHGAAGEDSAWTSRRSGYNFGDEFFKDFAILPLHVKYNSGLHISQNGQALTDLFEENLKGQGIKRIFIVGHSMGGLVFRSACHYGNERNHSWLCKIEKVFYLGSPHHGAPLEKFGAWTESILHKVNIPYSTLAAKLITLRSNGIKDLRHGYLLEEEWREDELHEFPVNNRKPHFHLETAEHYIIAATIHEDKDHFTTDWLGDMMVSKNSATGKSKHPGRHIDIAPENIKIFGGHHHIKLMQSPEVYDWISDRIGKFINN